MQCCQTVLVAVWLFTTLKGRPTNPVLLGDILDEAITITNFLNFGPGAHVLLIF